MTTPPVSIVLVGMTVLEAGHRDELQRLATNGSATVAFLQHGEPSLISELDRLAAAGAERLLLVGVALGSSPARSWLRRVAGHWLRQGADRPIVEVAPTLLESLDSTPALDALLAGASAATGDEAGLTSPPWEDVPRHRHHMLVCRGPRCAAQGADDTARALDSALAQAGLGDDDVLVTQTGCLFPCNQAPVVVVHPQDSWYGSVTPDVAHRIVLEGLIWGLPIRENRLARAAPPPHPPS